MSSSVFLSNVDDYFAPSQACVNPLFSGSSSQKEADEEEEEETKKKAKSKSNVVIPRQHRVRQRTRQQQVQQEQLQPPGVVVNNQNGGPVPSTMSESSSPTISSSSSTFTPKQNDMNENDTNNDKNNSMDPVVKASIADCLACSGCVTTAETVLLEEKHSLDLLRQRFVGFHNNNNNKDKSNPTNDDDDSHIRERPMVMTISPASWADLARHLDLASSTTTPPRNQTMNNHHHHEHHTIQYYQQRQWTTLLDQTFAGLALVLDGNVPLQWSRLQAAQEFCQAHEQKQPMEKSTSSTTSTTSNSSSNHASPTRTTSSSLPPILSSSCPAVVCLVEKSIHPAVPHLSTTKSAMSLAGAYWRNAASTTSTTQLLDDDDPPPPFFHVAVMPCHDKKLEASRSSSAAAAAAAATATTTSDAAAEMLLQSIQPPPDTDLVITTSECLQLLQEAQTLRRDASSFCLQDDNDKSTTLENNNNNNDASTGLRQTLLSCPPAPCITASSNDNKEEAEDDDDDAQSFLSRLDAVVAAASRNSATATKATAATFITVASSPYGSLTDAKMGQTPSSFISSSLSPFVHGSGGYADYIFRYACRHLYGFHIGQTINPWKPVEVTGTAAAAASSSSSASSAVVSGRIARKSVRVAASQQRNRQRDYYQAILYKHQVTGECSLEMPMNNNENDNDYNYEPVLKFAIAYGMQTLQRVLKPFHDAAPDTEQQQQQRDAFYDYIEAMACPSGCLNGGGQLPLTATTTTTTSRDMIKTNAGGNATTPRTAIMAARETPTQTRQRVQMTQSQFLLPTPSLPTDNTTTQPGDGSSLPSSPTLSSAILSRIPMAQRRITYHAVAPLQLSMGAAAGVAVKDIQW